MGSPIRLSLFLGRCSSSLRSDRVGLEADVTEDFLLLGPEDFGEIFVELGLFLLEFYK